MAVQYASTVLAQFDTNIALVTNESPDAGFKASGYRFDLDKEPDSAVDGTYYLDVVSVDPHARNWGTGENISECIVVVRVAYFRGGGDKNEGDRQSVLRNAADDMQRIADVCENPSNYNSASTGIREIRYRGSRRTGDLPRCEIWESQFWVQWRSDLAHVTGGSDMIASLVFDNNAEMAAYVVGDDDNGVIARVLTYRDFFVLDTETVRTAAADVVVAAANGAGYWVRMNIADPYWATQTEWGWSSSGSDEAAGTIADPVQTHEEIFRRTDGLTFASTPYFNILSNLPNQTFRIGYRATTAYYQAALTSFATGSATSVTTLAKASNAPWEITDTAIGTSWTASSLVDKLLVARSGASIVGTAWVDRDLGTKKARMAATTISAPLLVAGSAAAANITSTTDGTFTVGNTYTVYSQKTCGITKMLMQSDNIIVYGLDFTGDLVADAPSSSDLAAFIHCRFSGSATLGRGVGAWQCLFKGAASLLRTASPIPNCSFHGLCQWTQSTGNFVSNVYATNGGTIRMTHATKSGGVNPLVDVALFDVPIASVGFLVDYQSNTQIGLIWGKDNPSTTYLVQIGTAGNWIMASSTPVATTSGTQLRIGGTSYAWGDIGTGITNATDSGLVIAST